MASVQKRQILQLTDLVDYQDGSIVSRPVIKSDQGNITIFAFAGGQELSEHTAPFDALLHVLEGEIEVTISGQAYHLNSNEAIILPANEPHAVKARSHSKIILTMLRA